LVNTGALMPCSRSCACAGLVAVAEVGQHDHVGLALQLGDRRDGAVDRGLAVHLGVEEQVEVAPLSRRRQRLAVAPTIGANGLALSSKSIPCASLEPVAEVPHHVQQHFVAVGHDQRPVMRDPLARRGELAGVEASASAAATRSGSCAHRKSSTARWSPARRWRAQASGRGRSREKRRGARCVRKDPRQAPKRDVGGSLTESSNFLRIVSIR
jgi:hypothetical protein